MSLIPYHRPRITAFFLRTSVGAIFFFSIVSVHSLHMYRYACDGWQLTDDKQNEVEVRSWFFWFHFCCEIEKNSTGAIVENVTARKIWILSLAGTRHHWNCDVSTSTTDWKNQAAKIEDEQQRSITTSFFPRLSIDLDKTNLRKCSNNYHEFS